MIIDLIKQINENNDIIDKNFKDIYHILILYGISSFTNSILIILIIIKICKG